MKPVSEPRQGWDEAFKTMHDRKDDELMMPDVFDEDTAEEWI